MNPLHEPLLGRWEGAGSGDYPTVEAFAYEETIEILPVADKPLARWSSTSRDATSGAVRHGDSGYLRSTADGCELVLAHAFGITEVAATTAVGDGLFEFRSRSIGLAPTAKEVTATRRVLRVSGDVLEYDFWMAAVGVGMTHHLVGRLTRG